MKHFCCRSNATQDIVARSRAYCIAIARVTSVQVQHNHEVIADLVQDAHGLTSTVILLYLSFKP